MNGLIFILIENSESNKYALKPFPTPLDIRQYSTELNISVDFKFIMFELTAFLFVPLYIYLVEITKKLSDILDRCATTTQPSTVLLYTIFVDCFFFTLASYPCDCDRVSFTLHLNL